MAAPDPGQDDPGPNAPAVSTDPAPRSTDVPLGGSPVGRPAPLFLHRDTYRRRRVMDAARLLPFVGAALLLLPLLWAPGHGTASGAVYLFIAWFGLILAAAILSRKLSEPLRAPDPPAPDPRAPEGDP